MSTLFTFHYVSIKTVTHYDDCFPIRYLHSTMYLLKPAVAVAIAVAPCTFTFHYVSIKTITSIATLHMCNIFTFHYVSIKTRKMLRWRSLWFHLHSTMYLLKPTVGGTAYCKGIYIYIPLCIY